MKLVNPRENDLYQRLLADGIVSQSELDAVVAEADKFHLPFYSVLISKAIVDEGKALNVLSQVFGVEKVDLKSLSIDKSVAEKIPSRFAWHYHFFPIKINGTLLTVAVEYPLSISVQDEIRFQLGFEIKIVLAKRADIFEMLKKSYGLGSDTVERILSQSETAQFEKINTQHQKVEDIEKLAEDASVANLVNQIILDAYKKRATDIHIEPQRDKFRLRYRIDGVLYDFKIPDNIERLLLPILSRIKIMSNLNIVERRLPQDGRAIVQTKDQVLDLRVSFIPTPHGESVVIRLLPTKMLFDLAKLGLAPTDLDTITSLIEKPHGIIFVTGPTGSGKTTTLYAALNKINTPNKKIITIEDPIEYEIPGITQIQVNPGIGLTFAQGLRSMLRHDPDIMMVGEVRDLETAEIAIRVSLTGHLVFSTLHTNDAASGATRLIDIGVEPYLIASSVEAFIAQRLVRTICPHCKIEDTQASEYIRSMIARDLRLESSQSFKIFRGEGCEHCNRTGFYGRTAIYEILLINETIRQLIIDKASASQIKRSVFESKIHSMRQDGWHKVIAGATTPSEILDVTPPDITDEELHSAAESVSSASIVVGSPLKKQGAEKALEKDQDRRLFLRLRKNVEFEYKNVKNKDGVRKPLFSFGKKIATALNVSAGGLMFETGEKMQVGDIVEVSFETPDTQEMVTSLAKVVRVDTDEQSGFSKVALCYLDMTSAERAHLDVYVKKELEDDVGKKA